MSVGEKKISLETLHQEKLVHQVGVIDEAEFEDISVSFDSSRNTLTNTPVSFKAE